MFPFAVEREKGREGGREGGRDRKRKEMKDKEGGREGRRRRKTQNHVPACTQLVDEEGRDEAARIDVRDRGKDTLVWMLGNGLDDACPH